MWCFLAIRRLLVEELGFEEISSQKAKLMLSDQLDFLMKDGMYGAFHFERADGLKIKLAHEPIFHQKYFSQINNVLFGYLMQSIV